MTAAQIAANRAEAVTLIRATLGLSNRAPSDWTLDEREAYVDALAQYIADHPDRFAEIDLANAQSELSDGRATLLDDSFQWGDFAGEVGNNVVSAGEDVAGVGKGVLSALSSMQYVIPVIVIGGALFIAWRYANAVPVPKGKAKA